MILVPVWAAQGYVLHRAIDVYGNQNLSLMNLGVMVGWLMAAWVIASRSWKGFPLLALTVFVANALAQPWVSATVGVRIFSLGQQPVVVTHVFLSLVGYSLLGIAAIHSVAALWQDRRLKMHKAKPTPWLPPLLDTEKRLFRILLAAFAVLTLSYTLAGLYLYDLLSNQPLHKLVLALASWLLTGILLAGHRRLGWRGPQAARWTLTAFALLILSYFGTWLILSLRVA
jgi:ABC-type uncharacterized transport system permease subunit